MIDDLGVERAVAADDMVWVPVFTGLSVRQFRKLVGIVAARGGEQTGTGRRWGLSLADRVLLIAVYYRTNLTLRQVALLFGVSKSAAHRIVDHLAPLLTLAPVTKRHGPDTVLIVDGTLVPTHDRSVGVVEELPPNVVVKLLLAQGWRAERSACRVSVPIGRSLVVGRERGRLEYGVCLRLVCARRSGGILRSTGC